MQYMLMICDEESKQPQPGTSEFEKLMMGFMALEEEYRDTGMVLRGGGKLDDLRSRSSAGHVHTIRCKNVQPGWQVPRSPVRPTRRRSHYTDDRVVRITHDPDLRTCLVACGIVSFVDADHSTR